MPQRHDLRTPLAGLTQARLLTAALVLSAGVLLEAIGAFPYPLAPFAVAVSGAVLSSLALWLSRRRIAGLRRFALLHLLLDVALVTAIVATSGGPRSVFTVLYVPVVLEGAFLHSRAAGAAAAGLSSLFYSALVWGGTILPSLHLWGPTETNALDALTVFVNTGVLLIVALLAGSLGERYRLAQRDLATQDKHLSDLQAFRDQIFQSVGSGLIAVDPRNRITAFNQAAEAITGVPAAEALGRPWEAIFGDEVDLSEAQQTAAGPAGQSRRYEIMVSGRDGRVVPMGISFWLLRSGRGETVGLIGVCQDLTSIKQMEDRVREADRLAAIGRLAANIAHEIRNPLASLSAAIEALAKELPLDPGRVRLLDIVTRESERLNHIITDFLEYARPAPLALLEVNLADILDEVLLLLEHRAPAGALKVIREYGGVPPARLDSLQIRQAIWNLGVNAVESMPDGGELRVGARPLPDSAGDRIEVWIADSGHGIDERDLPHIFEPFYSTKPGGSGIGLAIVYRVVQDHGGQIEVRSRPGAGTTFILTLPRAVGGS